MSRPANAAIGELDETFSTLYAKRGRPGFPAERLLRAMIVRLLYTIRSGRRLVDRPGALSVSIIFEGLAAQP